MRKETVKADSLKRKYESERKDRLALEGEKPKQVMPGGVCPPPPELQKPGSAPAFEFKRYVH